MSVLPPDLKTVLEERGGLTVLGAAPVSGGMINQAAKLDTPNGPHFIKWHYNAPARLFIREREGLELLRQTATLRVPDVFDCRDREESESIQGPTYLLLEWIEQSPPTNPSFARRFGEALAALHMTPVGNHGFGLEFNNYIGSLVQRNHWREKWADFYRDCRILAQMEIAYLLGRLPEHRHGLLWALVERLDQLLDGLESRPSLLHGDLWSGNYLTVGDEAVVIDPAVYYGEREMEIAFMELFGGFPSGVLEAYNEAFPLQPGYERRRSLHQLYPLLVHLNHFGEPYGQDVDRVCRQYVD